MASTKKMSSAILGGCGASEMRHSVPGNLCTNWTSRLLYYNTIVHTYNIIVHMYNTIVHTYVLLLMSKLYQSVGFNRHVTTIVKDEVKLLQHGNGIKYASNARHTWRNSLKM